MIWYRHWLEMRATVLAAVGTAIIGSLFYVRDLIAAPAQDLTRRVDRSLFSPLMGLTNSFDTAQINLIAFHQEFTWYAILLLTFVLTGDGLKVNSFRTGAGLSTAPLFTLSLPVSRRRVVITRLVSTYVIGALALFVIAGTNAAAFSTTGYPAPGRPLLFASAFATLLVLFWSSLIVMMVGILGRTWGIGVTLPALLLSTPAGMYGMAASAAGQPGPGLLLLFAVAAVTNAAVAVSASEEV